MDSLGIAFIGFGYVLLAALLTGLVRAIQKHRQALKNETDHLQNKPVREKTPLYSNYPAAPYVSGRYSPTTTVAPAQSSDDFVDTMLKVELAESIASSVSDSSSSSSDTPSFDSSPDTSSSYDSGSSSDSGSSFSDSGGFGGGDSGGGGASGDY
jgi:uncharacterized membrane protein YgcG